MSPKQLLIGITKFLRRFFQKTHTIKHFLIQIASSGDRQKLTFQISSFQMRSSQQFPELPDYAPRGWHRPHHGHTGVSPDLNRHCLG